MNKDSNLIFEAYKSSKEFTKGESGTYGVNSTASETLEVLTDIISYLSESRKNTKEFKAYEELVRLIIKNGNRGFIVVKGRSPDVYGRAGWLVSENYQNLYIDKDKILKFYSLSNSPEYAPSDPNVGFKVWGDTPETKNRVFFVNHTQVDYEKSNLLALGLPPEDIGLTLDMLDI